MSKAYDKYIALYREWMAERDGMTEDQEDEYIHQLDRLWWEMTDEEQVKAEDEHFTDLFKRAAKKAVKELHENGISAWGMKDGEMVENPLPEKEIGRIGKLTINKPMMEKLVGQKIDWSKTSWK